MIIGYKNLFQNKKKFIYNKEYLKNFFNILKKLNLNEDNLINKISIELKNFYLEIYNQFKILNNKKKKDL